jgi:hypothetical protein
MGLIGFAMDSRINNQASGGMITLSKLRATTIDDCKVVKMFSQGEDVIVGSRIAA